MRIDGELLARSISEMISDMDWWYQVTCNYMQCLVNFNFRDKHHKVSLRWGSNVGRIAVRVLSLHKHVDEIS